MYYNNKVYLLSWIVIITYIVISTTRYNDNNNIHIVDATSIKLSASGGIASFSDKNKVEGTTKKDDGDDYNNTENQENDDIIKEFYKEEDKDEEEEEKIVIIEEDNESEETYDLSSGDDDDDFISYDYDVDMPGGDFKVLSVSNAEQCALECSKFQRCKAWVYYKEENNSLHRLCFLKKMIRKQVSHSCCVTGIQNMWQQDSKKEYDNDNDNKNDESTTTYTKEKLKNIDSKKYPLRERNHHPLILSEGEELRKGNNNYNNGKKNGLPPLTDSFNDIMVFDGDRIVSNEIVLEEGGNITMSMWVWLWPSHYTENSQHQSNFLSRIRGGMKNINHFTSSSNKIKNSNTEIAIMASKIIKMEITHDNSNNNNNNNNNNNDYDDEQKQNNKQTFSGSNIDRFAPTKLGFTPSILYNVDSSTSNSNKFFFACIMQGNQLIGFFSQKKVEYLKWVHLSLVITSDKMAAFIDGDSQGTVEMKRLLEVNDQQQQQASFNSNFNSNSDSDNSKKVFGGNTRIEKINKPSPNSIQDMSTSSRNSGISYNPDITYSTLFTLGGSKRSLNNKMVGFVENFSISRGIAYTQNDVQQEIERTKPTEFPECILEDAGVYETDMLIENFEYKLSETTNDQNSNPNNNDDNNNNNNNNDDDDDNDLEHDDGNHHKDIINDIPLSKSCTSTTCETEDFDLEYQSLLSKSSRFFYASMMKSKGPYSKPGDVIDVNNKKVNIEKDYHQLACVKEKNVKATQNLYMLFSSLLGYNSEVTPELFKVDNDNDDDDINGDDDEDDDNINTDDAPAYNSVLNTDKYNAAVALGFKYFRLFNDIDSKIEEQDRLIAFNESITSDNIFDHEDDNSNNNINDYNINDINEEKNKNYCELAGSYYFPVARWIIENYGDSKFNIKPIENVQLESGRFQGHKGEDDDIMQYQLEMAEKGDPDAQVWVGKTQFWGRGGVATNQAEAVNWFERAAAQDHPEALYNIGVLHLNGDAGYETDASKSIEYFEKAADKNFTPAQNGLGAHYMQGTKDRPRNYTMAFQYFKAAADEGSVDGHYNLGIMYRDGLGIKKDPYKAAEHIIYAASQRHAKSLFSIAGGLWEHNSWLDSYGKQQKGEKSVIEHVGYRIPLERNCEMSVLFMKQLIEMGPWSNNALRKGIVSFMENDLEKSNWYYDIASEFGIVMAQENSAWLSQILAPSVTPKILSTLNSEHLGYVRNRWVQMANQGSATALRYLGDMSFYGHGTNQSYRYASSLYKLSAESGDYHSKFNLAYAYQWGLGVSENKTIAENYYMEISQTESEAAWPAYLAFISLQARYFITSDKRTDLIFFMLLKGKEMFMNRVKEIFDISHHFNEISTENFESYLYVSDELFLVSCLGIVLLGSYLVFEAYNEYFNNQRNNRHQNQ